ncbi:hypothetical protein H4R33_001723 [Dimargaris cristalligena]|nr:hypothetical protein H4R33_001723 [Dimargaris cristalligena]
MYAVSMLSLLGLTLLPGTTTALPNPRMPVTEWNHPKVSNQANNHLQRRGLPIYKPKGDSDTEISNDGTGSHHPNASGFDDGSFSILDPANYSNVAANQQTLRSFPGATESLLMQSRAYIVQAMLDRMTNAQNVPADYIRPENGLTVQEITEAIQSVADYRSIATRNVNWVNVAQLSDEQKRAVIPGFTLINQGLDEPIRQFLDFVVNDYLELANEIEEQVKPRELDNDVLLTVFNDGLPYWDDLDMTRIWAVNMIILLVQTRQWSTLRYYIGKMDFDVNERLVYVWYVVVITAGLRNQLPLFESQASFARDMAEYLEVIQGSLEEQSLDDFIQCANDWNLPEAATFLQALGGYWEIPLTNRGLCPGIFAIPSTISFGENGYLAVLVDESFTPI